MLNVGSNFSMAKISGAFLRGYWSVRSCDIYFTPGGQWQVTII